MNFAVLQHVPYEGPGLLSEVAESSGVSLSLRRLWLGESLPGCEEIDGLIVLGGPQSASDTESHPYLGDEVQLLAACAERDLPVLGICLGAQLLARALGAWVSEGPVEEVGIGEVSLTDQGTDDPILGPAGSSPTVFHWHRDTFDLPPEAVRLAESDSYPNQAFRMGRRVYGFQFHLELDASLAHEVVTHLPTGVTLDREQVAAVEDVGRKVLPGFFRKRWPRA
jgi:GMP synthase-like glutamine amidotransferase